MESQSGYVPVTNSIELVIFDCDGVVVDSELICAEVLSRELQAAGIPITSEYVLKHFLGHSYSSMERKIEHNLQVAVPEDFKFKYRDQLVAAFEQRLQETPGVLNMLSALNVDSCIATSSSATRTRHALEVVGLADFFGNNVFTASEVKRGKPAPDLFLHAVASMNSEPERCLVIEDSIAGITAALAAGMRVWRYSGGSHFRKALRPLPNRYAGLPDFDDWLKFFQMAPYLNRRNLETE